MNHRGVDRCPVAGFRQPVYAGRIGRLALPATQFKFVPVAALPRRPAPNAVHFRYARRPRRLSAGRHGRGSGECSAMIAVSARFPAEVA
jgi:hypothetical protein